ncbi:MAG: hypothetical protein U0451_01125 [Candidatus Saccharimonadales bacterium]
MSWLKQTKQKPLFEDLLWSQPENKLHAGKLLIIGGNLHSFSAPSAAYRAASKAGAGTIRLILPVSLKKTVGKMIPECEYGPVTPSGSFNKQSLGIFLDEANWSDGILLAGDFGRNSETAVLVESFVSKYQGLVVATKDAADCLISAPNSIQHRSNTTLVLTLDQLQRLSKSTGSNILFKYETPVQDFAEKLAEFTSQSPFMVIVRHLSQTWCALGSNVSATEVNDNESIWCIETAASTAVWQIQNPSQLFSAATTALVI